MSGRIIVLTGGGSGGHITPILAIATEIKKADHEIKTIYIGQRGDNLADIAENHHAIDETYAVRAGKFRRYHGEGFRQLLDLKTMYKNVRDAFYVAIGLWQSWRLLGKLTPDIIFVKGGFVGVPVGLAAAARHIPYITHDSDAVPGLANKIIARWALKHAVALPKDVYSYPPDKTVTTGTPVQKEFVPVTKALRATYRKKIGIPESSRFLFIIGGGLGSQRVNDAFVQIMPHLLSEFKDLYVAHGVGRANEASMAEHYRRTLDDAQLSRVQSFGFTDEVYAYSGAADLIVTRAGATNLAEFALQGKACIVIPSPFLAGGHQLKNAQLLERQHAVAVVNEDDLSADPNRLAKAISDLLQDETARHHLETAFSSFAAAHATEDIASLLIRLTDKGKDAIG